MKQNVVFDESRYCDVCGISWLYPIDEKEHGRKHKCFLEARDYFGKENVLNRNEREHLKSVSWRILRDDSFSIDEKVKAAKNILRAWFARSLEAWAHSKIHPKFEVYAAMMLNTLRFPSEIQAELIKEYGIKAGIPEGRSLCIKEAR